MTGYCISMGGPCGFAYGEQFALPHPIGAGDMMGLLLGGKGNPAAAQVVVG
jgi:hypothetical protein